jgi:squalene-associated FAD-dependent desaturase
MPARTAHVIGAGLAGLAAATALTEAGYKVTVHEGGPQAGGRCRSYFDKELDHRIDNGNHLLLSGNQHAMRYLERIGARQTMVSPPEAIFPFIDLKTAERWNLRPNKGKLPWWLFRPDRRVPGSKASDYLELLKLPFARADATLAQTLDTKSLLFRRLWEPLIVSGLNTQAHEASTRLFWAIVRETLGAGGQACVPMIPAEGLSESFVDPAIAYLEKRWGTVHLKQRLHRLVYDGASVVGLDFQDSIVPVTPATPVILAVPAPVALGLVPGLIAPTEHRSIANIHFKVETKLESPGFMGVIGGTAEWVFQRPGILSVTISAAEHVADLLPEKLAESVWDELRRIYELPAKLPLWRVVKEKRATFAATPAQEKLRPMAQTRWQNLLLAGDWTATNLPSTIEGSLRSGHTAAGLILKKA